MQYTKHNRIFATLILFFIVFLLIIFSYSDSNLQSANIKHGQFSLPKEGYEHTLFALNGSWEFYPNTFLIEDLDTIKPHTPALKKTSTFIEVPSSWTQLDGSQTKTNTPPLYGTYELNLTLPSPGTYMIKTSFISSAYRVYCNGSYIGGVGAISTDAVHEESIWRPMLLSFTSDTTSATLTFQVSNFSCFQGGIVSDVYLGTVNQITNFHTLQTLKSALLIGIFLGLGFYLLLLTCKHHHKQAGYFLFLFCMASAVLESILDVGLLLYIFPNLSSLFVIKIEFLAYCLLLISMHYFVRKIYPSLKLHGHSRILSYCNWIYLILILISPSFSFTTQLSRLYIIMFILNVMFFLITLYYAVKIKKPYAFISLFSVIFLGLLCLTQIILSTLQSSVRLYTTANLYSIGLLLFLLCQVNVLLIDVDEAYENAQLADTMEIAFLQAQISPHFVFNTLNNIYCLMSSNI